MTAWWVEKVLPGVASSSIWAVVLWLSHRRLRRHIDTVTARQNEHIDQLTASQAAALAGTGQHETEEAR